MVDEVVLGFRPPLPDYGELHAQQTGLIFNRADAMEWTEIVLGQLKKGPGHRTSFGIDVPVASVDAPDDAGEMLDEAFLFRPDRIRGERVVERLPTRWERRGGSVTVGFTRSPHSPYELLNAPDLLSLGLVLGSEDDVRAYIHHLAEVEGALGLLVTPLDRPDAFSDVLDDPAAWGHILGTTERGMLLEAGSRPVREALIRSLGTTRGGRR